MHSVSNPPATTVTPRLGTPGDLPARLGWSVLIVVAVAHLMLLCLLMWYRANPSTAEAPILSVQFVSEPDSASPASPAPPSPTTRQHLATQVPGHPLKAPTQTEVAQEIPHLSDSVHTPTTASTLAVTPFNTGHTPSGQAPSASTLSNTNSPPHFAAEHLQNPKPRYPKRSQALGETGKVLLKVFVESTGRPSSVTVLESSGYERLDAAALESVAQWRFVPARIGENAVGAWVLVPVPFKLE